MKREKFVRDYRNDQELRHSFNELAQKTFGIDFENWYKNGYWTEKYDPHSIVVDGKVVANVSVNVTDFVWNGERKRFLQLGTVMADEAHRKKGYIRKIMEEIDREYENKVDGMYLFANDSVLTFYPKFGFRAAKQYEYAREVSFRGERIVEQVPMKDKKDWDRMERLIRENGHCCKFDMTGNSELNMFYLSQFMQENVYYIRKLDTYVVAEEEEGELLIDMIIAPQTQNPEVVAEAFGKDIHRVRLGFMPMQTTDFSVSEVWPNDCTLFIKGKGFDGYETEKLIFPLLAHA